MKTKDFYIYGVVIVLITTLLGIIITLLNIPVSWVVCDSYQDYRECYKVNMKYIDYLQGNDKEYYTELRRIEYDNFE